ncbi:HTH-type transcriptional regulator AdhR [compost metagenome]
MNKHLSISQLSTLLGLSVHTLRYYERIGLLDAVSRDGSGHRVYLEKDLRWVEFLVRLRTTGMPIQQMLSYAELRRQGDATLAARRELLEEHRRAVALRIEVLSRSLDALDGKISLYQRLEREVNADEYPNPPDQQVPSHSPVRSEHD